MHRIIMSLKSDQSTDVEYSMRSIVRISFEAGDDLHAEHWPALCDVLFLRLRENLAYVAAHLKPDQLQDEEFAKRLQYLNELALVIRNMSLSLDNAKWFALKQNPKDVLTEGLALKHHPILSEFVVYAMDMVEQMATWLPLKNPNDLLIDAILSGLASEDRVMLIGSMRAACRLINREGINRLAAVPISTIHRLTAILMLEDEELVSSCLDFLHQYTADEENCARLLAPPDGLQITLH